MKTVPASIQGLVIVEPEVFSDDRGFFMETYHRRRYADSGIDGAFVQDNLSCSKRGTLRGLHYQISHPQAKLVQVIAGEVFDVVVDLRSGSVTFGEWTGVTLSGKNGRQLYVPEGFAHGFCVLSATAHFSYKCSDYYAPMDEAGILWSDPDLGIDWPVSDPIVSEKDGRLPLLTDIPTEQLPRPT